MTVASRPRKPASSDRLGMRLGAATAVWLAAYVTNERI